MLAVQEARDHGLELVASVVAPGELGEIASGVVGAEPATVPVIALLMFPSVVLTHLKDAVRAALRPEPVRTER